MTEKLKQQIEEKMSGLPKNTKGIINSFGWIGMSEEIGRKYLLDDSEINMLQAEAGLALAGLIDPDLFIKNIEVDIGTSRAEAEKIANEVLEKIFKPIAAKIEENIKESAKTKDANLSQNVNFILSGGDYAHLATPKENSTLSSPGEGQGEVK